VVANSLSIVSRSTPTPVDVIELLLSVSAVASCSESQEFASQWKYRHLPSHSLKGRSSIALNSCTAHLQYTQQPRLFLPKFIPRQIKCGNGLVPTKYIPKDFSRQHSERSNSCCNPSRNCIDSVLPKSFPDTSSSLMDLLWYNAGASAPNSALAL
jgi:hypothetical protein